MAAQALFDASGAAQPSIMPVPNLEPCFAGSELGTLLVEPPLENIRNERGSGCSGSGKNTDKASQKTMPNLHRQHLLDFLKRKHHIFDAYFLDYGLVPLLGTKQLYYLGEPENADN